MSAMGTAIAQIVVGLIENLFGRKLFWLFVAVGGFMVGWYFAPAIWETVHASGTMELWQRLVIGLVAAVVLGFLALRFTRIMVSIAGFFVFAAATVLAIDYFGGNVDRGTTNFWIAFACGGVVGAIILGFLFDWALIVLTALFGAGATVDGVLYFFTPESPTPADPGPAKWIKGVAIGVLFLIGLAFQIRTRRRKSKRARTT
jgi:MFS family permease